MNKIFFFLLLGIRLAVCTENPAVKPANENLIGSWPMDEGRGTEIKDTSGNENHGTIHGAIWVSVNSETALDFNRFENSTDYVDCGAKRILNPVHEISIETWVYTRAKHAGYFVLKKNAYGIAISKGSIKFILFMNSGKIVAETASPCFATNEWHHLVCTYDGNFMRIYIDGEEMSKKEMRHCIDSSPSPLLLGWSEGWSDVNFDGKIGKLKIYNKSLKPEQIEKNFEKQLPVYNPAQEQPSSASSSAYKTEQYTGRISAEERTNWLNRITPSKTEKPQSTAEIKLLGDVPTIFVNGTPKGPMMYTGPYPLKYPVNSEYIAKLAECGIQIHFLPMAVIDPLLEESPDVYYKQVLDPIVNKIVAASPDAFIILRLGYPTSDEFMKRYPEELMRFDDGKPDHYTNSAVGNLSGRYSLASTVWERCYAKALLNLINYLRNSTYSDRIIGYLPTAAAYGQWLYWFDYDHNKYTIDFSPAMQKSFKNYLIRRYNNESNLQKAWNDPDVNFDTARIPSREEREQYEFGYFIDPSENLKLLDYYTCMHEEVAERVIYLSKVIKKATGGNALTGFFYGALGTVNYLLGGQSAFKKVLGCESIDFLSNPPGYENRGAGDAAPLAFATASTKLNRKIWIVEADTRTCFSGQGQITCGAPENLSDSISVLKRDFSQVLCEGVTGYWFEFRYGWYDHPDILSLFSQMQEIGRIGLESDRRSNCETAVIVDQESLFTCSSFLSKQLLDRQRIHELSRIGCAYDFLEMADIEKADIKRYKLFIFLNAFSMTNEERQKISRLLKKDGRTLVWVYAPGLINPEKSPSLSVAHMEELTGIRLGTLRDGRYSMDMKITNFNHTLTSQCPKGYIFGSFTRPVTTDAQGATPDKPYKLKPLEAKPQIFADDKESVTLAEYADSRKAGYAVKKFPDWTSIYAGSACIPSLLMRQIAQFAGVHIYLDSDDIVYHNKNFLAVHVKEPGMRIINLPVSSDVYDLFSKKFIAKNTNKFSLFLEKNETRLFYTGSSDNIKWAK